MKASKKFLFAIVTTFSIVSIFFSVNAAQAGMETSQDEQTTESSKEFHELLMSKFSLHKGSNKSKCFLSTISPYLDESRDCYNVKVAVNSIIAEKLVGKNGSVDIIKAFLDNPANLCEPDLMCNIMLTAVEYNQIKILEYLIFHQAKYIDQIINNLEVTLIKAAHIGSLDCVVLFITHPILYRYLCGQSLGFALVAAIEGHHQKIIDLLALYFGNHLSPGLLSDLFQSVSQANKKFFPKELAARCGMGYVKIGDIFIPAL